MGKTVIKNDSSILWQGKLNQTNVTQNLSESLKNYSTIVIVCTRSSEEYYFSTTIPTNMINNGTIVTVATSIYGGYSATMDITFVNNSSFYVELIDYHGWPNVYLKEIYAIR